MPVPRPFAALILSTTTGWHLAVQTGSDVLAGIWCECRDRSGDEPLRRRVAKVCRYYLGWALDPRTFFAIDGDGFGRRRHELDEAARRQRRILADQRRRHAGMLLRALGDTADGVQASLTRHWRIYGGDYADLLIEDYLCLRLLWRDRPVYHQIDVYPWAANVSGVWVATPAPVRAYLRGRFEHQRRLEAAQRPHPRRGPRNAPAARAA
jgi:hypothetical protein